MKRILQALVFLFVIRPFFMLISSRDVHHSERLPVTGPAIVVANHNSHLDTLALMSLFPMRMLKRVRPVAAADYFMRNATMRFISQGIIGIIPIKRKRSTEDEDVLAGCSNALAKGDILILFPEGSRGEPEKMAELKKGIAILSERHPDAPVVPVFLHGFGMIWPRGEARLIPHNTDIIVGCPLRWCGDRDKFMENIKKSITDLAAEGRFSL